jgi:hypothetical protein
MSGYLVPERPAPVGYRHLRRLQFEGWAADIHGRETE